MKKKILMPVFASFMALSMNGIAHADDSKTDNKTDKKELKEKNIIDLKEYKDIEFKIAEVKEDVAVKVRKQGTVKTIAYSGDQFKIVGEQDGWYKVKLDDETQAWIASRYVDVKAGSAYINEDKVNVRKDAHVDSEIQDNLKVATKVKVLEKDGNWVKVRAGETEGYIRDLYLSEKAPKEDEKQLEKNDVKSSNKKQEKNKQERNKQERNKQDRTKNESSYNTQTRKIKNNKHSVVKEEKVTNKENNNKEESSYISSNSSVIDLAYSKLGCPYVWGAEGPNSFDCSGLTSYVFRKAGVSLPRTSSSQYGVGRSVSRSNLQAGDLVFFATGGGGISHVGIYVGGGNMVHAPQTGDVVKVSNINSSYWQKTYVGAKRVL